MRLKKGLTLVKFFQSSDGTLGRQNIDNFRLEYMWGVSFGSEAFDA